MSYKDARKEIAEQLDATVCCRVCGSPTPHATLADFGAMCLGCYNNYCHAVPAAREPSKYAKHFLATMRKGVR